MLPPELWEHIMSLTEPRSLLSLSLSSRAFWVMASQQRLWVSSCRFHQTVSPLDALVNIDPVLLYCILRAGFKFPQAAVCPLSVACRLPDKRLVNLLLHFGYGNETNDDNSCAFMDLLKIQHPVAADWLRRGIVNPNTVSDMGETPFMIACQLGLENMCSLMLSCGLDLRYTTPRGRTLLHDVCRFGLVNVAKALIAAGAPNQADVFGTTPMHEAVRSMRSDTFTILDGPMTADLWGLTPLKLAIKIQSSCFDDMLQVEIMNQIPSDDIPALHYCVITNKLAHARRLLEAKCDVNLQNNQDKTALHYASQLRDMDAFALLLEFGAKVEIKDTFGQSPLTIVVTSDLACAHLLSTEQKGMLKKATIGFRSGQLLENKKWCMIPETSVSIC